MCDVIDVQRSLSNTLTSKPGSPRAFIMFLLATNQATLWHVSQKYHRRAVNHAVGNKKTSQGFVVFSAFQGRNVIAHSKTNWGFKYVKRFCPLYKQQEEMIEIIAAMHCWPPFPRCGHQNNFFPGISNLHDHVSNRLWLSTEGAHTRLFYRTIVRSFSCLVYHFVGRLP